MSDYLIHDSTLEDIADAIRSKTGGSALINPEDMADEIESIQTGGDGGNGLVEFAFNYTQGNRTWSGLVEDNSLKNYSDSGSYSIMPLLLKEPIIINDGDVIVITYNGSAMFANIGFVCPFMSPTVGIYGKIVCGNNVFVEHNTQINYTYLGDSCIVDRMFAENRNGASSNVSFSIGLSINGQVVF